MSHNFKIGGYRPRWTISKLCVACCEYFTTTRKDAKTCSPKCRQWLSRELRRSLGGQARTDTHQ